MRVETRHSSGDDLSVDRSDRYRCARFVLRGVVDARTSGRLAGLLIDACTDRSVDVVVTDLSGVTFLSAAGLACFDRVAEIASAHHTALSLWDPSPLVRRILAAGVLHPAVLVEPPGPR